MLERACVRACDAVKDEVDKGLHAAKAGLDRVKKSGLVESVVEFVGDGVRRVVRSESGLLELVEIDKDGAKKVIKMGEKGFKVLVPIVEDNIEKIVEVGETGVVKVIEKGADGIDKVVELGEDAIQKAKKVGNEAIAKAAAVAKEAKAKFDLFQLVLINVAKTGVATAAAVIVAPMLAPLAATGAPGAILANSALGAITSTAGALVVGEKGRDLSNEAKAGAVRGAFKAISATAAGGCAGKLAKDAPKVIKIAAKVGAAQVTGSLVETGSVSEETLKYATAGVIAAVVNDQLMPEIKAAVQTLTDGRNVSHPSPVKLSFPEERPDPSRSVVAIQVVGGKLPGFPSMVRQLFVAEHHALLLTYDDGSKV
uniref:Uncharacterized protein n=1 Tax=Chromera velia CCMP2878 TaxID=1169474 RepID=A0A0G4FA10_9ALVE|eukprot:Cvel_15975.t1-p1 / transcript=Cvel_15975.t1 / gene=Cvel_15975 / organism=Chromera_velia_CCMP2878 / gene_product=hypothetical protein / transcript_product=hypothetical protein / location=Cvel_scaffold1209:49505-51185(-) / protein_length=367 / sequence_SO=supercontig / SO=protein_coding / is_pseudo=false